MLFNPFYFMPPPVFTPLDMRPPKLIDVMESIVNYGKSPSERIGCSQLSNYARTTIFNFSYPLTNKVNKEEFERLILNHFINRRIGFETVSLFRIQLEVRLNEIMPKYNKMFDFLDGWNLFEDGEEIERTINENKTKNENKTNNTNSSSSNTSSNSSATNTTTDSRNSDTPQNELTDVRDGKYVDKYSYITNNGTDNSSASGSSSNSQTSVDSGVTVDSGETVETVKHSPSNKLEIYQKFLEDKNNIYSLIFKDLDELFYQLAE